MSTFENLHLELFLEILVELINPGYGELIGLSGVSSPGAYTKCGVLLCLVSPFLSCFYFLNRWDLLGGAKHHIS